MTAQTNGVDRDQFALGAALAVADTLDQIHELVASIDSRVAGLEAKFAEYEPLIEMLRARADRSSRWPKFGGSTSGS